MSAPDPIDDSRRKIGAAIAERWLSGEPVIDLATEFDRTEYQIELICAAYIEGTLKRGGVAAWPLRIPPALAEIPVAQLGLSMRSENCLHNYHKGPNMTLGDLALASKQALLATNNLGQKSLAEIQRAVSAFVAGYECRPRKQEGT